MKKLSACFLSLILIMQFSISTYANYQNNPLEFDKTMLDNLLEISIQHSVDELVKLDIVRNPERWNGEDGISRRNALEMLYIVYKCGWRIMDFRVQTNLFLDVEKNTYDDYLAGSLMRTPFFKGKTDENGNRIADFDSDITYYESITAMSKMLGDHPEFNKKIEDVISSNTEDTYPYFTLFEKIGLINSNTIVNYSTLSVTKDMLNTKIPARKFMYLVYNFLYVPHVKYTWNSATYGNFRYIDYFVSPHNGYFGAVASGYSGFQYVIP